MIIIKNARHPATAGLLLLALSTSIGAAPFSFTPIGDLPGGLSFSLANGISHDGSVVVGRAGSEDGAEAFRWTSAGGMVGIGEPFFGTFSSEALAVSNGGSVVVGWASAAGSQVTTRWTSSGMDNLGDLPTGELSAHATGVSADGSVIVGIGTVYDFAHDFGTTQAFRWTSSEGLVGLGYLPGGFRSDAHDVSADGSVIVGYAFGGGSGAQAFRWTSGEGMVPLGDLPGGIEFGSAHGVSEDGQIIVGYSNSTAGYEAFRWTSDEGMVGLGDLPGGTFRSVAKAVSLTGSVVVGQGESPAGSEAFLWTPASGIVSLQDYLVAKGVSNLAGWTLTDARDISSDGTTIVGHGINPLGRSEGWVVTIPEPGSGVLAILACILFWTLRRRFE